MFLLACGYVNADEFPHVLVKDFVVADDLEVSLWAKSPMFFNPTNFDVDYQGRIWVAEGKAYRGYRNRYLSKNAKLGDRIMVLADTDQDGKADKSHVFVQDAELIAPLGIAVIDNKVVVSQPPSLIVYHDVNRDAVFDPKIDKKEALLTGFGGKDHDHSLHAVTTGPSGQWYFNTGNAGTHVVEDKDGWTLRLGSAYRSGSPSVTAKGPNQGGKAGLVSDDGHVYVGGAVLRMNSDGTGLRVIGHNMRNSYEETVNSFGDVFQNDNDDPPACRTTWLMEYGNMGFASDNGSRKWQLDRRPGQPTAVAHWRQEDPGKLPAGDVYGNGSPTGICYYENGALGARWNGLLLSCEAARNVVFGYFPKPQGAGFALERFDFLKAKSDQSASSEANPNHFRPSDVMVGPDGCIYVADWYDQGVGGHRAADRAYAGAIYRIAPKGKGQNPTPPRIDLETTAGQLAAIKSSALNVRNLGFTRLKDKGEASLDVVRSLLEEDSDYLVARGIWLLAQLGDKGIAEVTQLLTTSEDPRIRMVCFRALRFVDHKVLDLVGSLAADGSVAIRREAALALRNYPWSDVSDLLYQLAIQYDGEDRWYLEAIGTAATGKEAQLYQELVTRFDKRPPNQWSTSMARLAWRLHPEAAVDALLTRALDATIGKSLRLEMITALGYIKTQSAALAMVAIAETGPEDTKGLAQWWLASLSTSEWRKYKSLMKGFNIKPSALPTNVDYIIPFTGPAITNPTIAEVVSLEGDAERGKVQISRCYMCHQVSGKGIEFGPNLTQWGIGRSVEAIAEAIIDPNVGIAHGYDASEVVTTDGNTMQGLVLEAGSKQVVLRVMGGELSIDAKSVESNKLMERSLMPTAGQLGLQSQDIADIVAHIRAIGAK